MTPRIAVASGKGGTGKTTVAVALALALTEAGTYVQFLDCDVEEPNAHLLIKPHIAQKMPVTLRIPKVDPDRCTGCGKCHQVCQYNAIAVVQEKAMIFENLCHACGGCSLACPEGAITEDDKVIGTVETGKRDGIDFLHGILNVGEPMATPIIRALRAQAKQDIFTIMDAPPGTACPVIATVSDCDYCLLVTEPTPFGLYDLGLMVNVVNKLGLPAGLVINKDDAWSTNVEAYAAQNDLPVLLRIPFSREIAELYSRGRPLTELGTSWTGRLNRLRTRIEQRIS